MSTLPPVVPRHVFNLDRRFEELSDLAEDEPKA